MQEGLLTGGGGDGVAPSTTVQVEEGLASKCIYDLLLFAFHLRGGADFHWFVVVVVV